MKKYLCIYHGNCADGFTAAWVLRNALGEENVDFVPGFYGHSIPDAELINLPEYEVVYMVDFSYKRNVLIDVFAARCKKIIIIDHHKTAQEDLVNLPDNVETVFDMEHSGAMLTWLYFVKVGALPVFIPGYRKDPISPLEYVPIGVDLSKYAPALIQRVEDRDLWKFKFSDTRNVAAKLFSHEYTFENWDKLAREYNDEPAGAYSGTAHKLKEIFLAEGAAIERKHFKDIKELLTACQTRGNILGHNVPIANLPYIYSSDAGHIMGVGEKFAGCYWYTATHCVWSLRSADDGMDVSAIAKEFGGGGHKHAAGFQFPLDQLPKFGTESAGAINLIKM